MTEAVIQKPKLQEAFSFFGVTSEEVSQGSREYIQFIQAIDRTTQLEIIEQRPGDFNTAVTAIFLGLKPMTEVDDDEEERICRLAADSSSDISFNGKFLYRLSTVRRCIQNNRNYFQEISPDASPEEIDAYIGNITLSILSEVSNAEVVKAGLLLGFEKESCVEYAKYRYANRVFIEQSALPWAKRALRRSLYVPLEEIIIRVNQYRDSHPKKLAKTIGRNDALKALSRDEQQYLIDLRAVSCKGFSFYTRADNPAYTNFGTFVELIFKASGIDREIEVLSALNYETDFEYVALNISENISQAVMHLASRPGLNSRNWAINDLERAIEVVRERFEREEERPTALPSLDQFRNDLLTPLETILKFLETQYNPQGYKYITDPETIARDLLDLMSQAGLNTIPALEILQDQLSQQEDIDFDQLIAAFFVKTA